MGHLAPDTAVLGWTGKERKRHCSALDRLLWLRCGGRTRPLKSLQREETQRRQGCQGNRKQRFPRLHVSLKYLQGVIVPSDFQFPDYISWIPLNNYEQRGSTEQCLRQQTLGPDIYGKILFLSLSVSGMSQEVLNFSVSLFSHL